MILLKGAVPMAKTGVKNRECKRGTFVDEAQDLNFSGKGCYHSEG